MSPVPSFHRRTGILRQTKIRARDMEMSMPTDFEKMDRTMQDCFRQHPDIYGSELEEDQDQDQEPESDAPTPAPDAPIPTSSPLTASPDQQPIPLSATSATSEPQSPLSSSTPDASAGASDTERARAAKQQVESDHGSEPISESDNLVPKAAHDATGGK